MDRWRRSVSLSVGPPRSSSSAGSAVPPRTPRALGVVYLPPMSGRSVCASSQLKAISLSSLKIGPASAMPPADGPGAELDVVGDQDTAGVSEPRPVERSGAGSASPSQGSVPMMLWMLPDARTSDWPVSVGDDAGEVVEVSRTSVEKAGAHHGDRGLRRRRPRISRRHRSSSSIGSARVIEGPR